MGFYPGDLVSMCLWIVYLHQAIQIVEGDGFGGRAHTHSCKAVLPRVSGSIRQLREGLNGSFILSGAMPDRGPVEVPEKVAD